MKTRSIPRLPEEAFFSAGGFTHVKACAWRAYMRRTLWRCFPRYTLWQRFNPGERERWKDNRCIWQALAEHLRADFGLVIPEDSLFKVYNRRGAGAAPQLLLPAMTAVLAPFGYAVQRVLAVDGVLREALGDDSRVVGPEQAGSFAGRAGVGMIHLHGDASHAFYWPAIKPGLFLKDEFRLAATIKREDEAVHETGISLRCTFPSTSGAHSPCRCE